MRFQNLTPHVLNILDEEGEQVLALPSEGVARCAVAQRVVEEHDGVVLFAQEFGEVEGLPEPEEGTIYVVSLLVRQAVPHRRDLASPGQLVRDEAGQPVGCKGLAVNR